MNGRNRTRCSVFPKLGMLFLFVMSALVPSMASARDVQHWASSATICYPDYQHCQTLRGQAMWNEIAAINFTYMLETSCSGNPSYCGMPTRQQWTFWFDANPGMSGPYSVGNPATGIPMSYSPPPGLPGLCKQIDNYEDYTCVAGTGGPWGEWVLTVSYW